MKPTKLVILLIIVVGNSQAQIDKPVVPYIDTTGNFCMNYTGACVEGIPCVAFTNGSDSLDIDSLLTIYPTVIIMDEEAFEQFVSQKLEEQND
jgi:hypothetical protein